MPQASVLPFPNLVDLLRLDGVSIDVFEDHQELGEGPYDPREESVPPDMAYVPMDTIIRHREHAHDPLHDAGEGFPPARAYHEVEVIPHKGEILDPEVVPLSGPGDDLKEKLLHAPAIQDHLFPVRPGRDMVEGPGP